MASPGLRRAVAKQLHSPYHQYKNKKLFPLAVSLHLLVLVLATVLITTHVQEVSRLKRRAMSVYSTLLFPIKRRFDSALHDTPEGRISALSADIDLSPNENLGPSSYYIISSKQLVRDTNLLVGRFFNLSKQYVGCAHNVCNLTMSGHAAITKYQNSAAFNRSASWHYSPLEEEYHERTLSPQDQGLPKEMVLGHYWNQHNHTVTTDDALFAWIERLVLLDIKLAIVTDDFSVPFDRFVLRSAYTLRIQYTTMNRGEVQVTMEPELYEFPLPLCFPVDTEQVQPQQTVTNGPANSIHILLGFYLTGKVILVIACLISAISYQLVLVRDVLDSCKLWRAVANAKAHALVQRPSSNTTRSTTTTTAAAATTTTHTTCWTNLALMTRVYNLSIICGTLGNFCLIVYSGMYLIHAAEVNTCEVSSSFKHSHQKFADMADGGDTANFLMACAVMLLWFDVLQYFVYGPEGGNLRTLQQSYFKVGRVLIFVCPVYVGFVVFGVSTFGGQTPQFATFSSAAIVLFATLNGDECRQAYTAIQQDCTDCASPLVGWIYMSAWLCFAMYVVLNIVIAIIEDVYMSLRETSVQEQHAQVRTTDDVAFDQVLAEVNGEM